MSSSSFFLGWCANTVNVMTLMIRVKLLLISSNFGKFFIWKECISSLNRSQMFWCVMIHIQHTIDLSVVTQTRIKWPNWSIFFSINFGQLGLILLFNSLVATAVVVVVVVFSAQKRFTMNANFGMKWIDLRRSKSKNKQQPNIWKYKQWMEHNIYMCVHFKRIYANYSEKIMWIKSNNNRGRSKSSSSHRKWVRVRNSLFIVRAS